MMKQRKKPKLSSTTYAGRRDRLRKRIASTWKIKDATEKQAELRAIEKEKLQLAEMRRRYRERYLSAYAQTAPLCELEQI